MRFLLITLIFTFQYNSLLFSQYKLSDLEKLIQNKRICQRNAYTVDTLKAKYLSNIIYYDSLGRSLHEITYNSDNEVEDEINTKYKGDSIEITTYNTSGSVDTSIEKYDKLGRKYYEHWYWADDSPHETWFKYNSNTDTLINSITKYSKGFTIDSFYYSNQLLIFKKEFNESKVLVKEFIYSYDGKLLVELKELNRLTNQIESVKKYTYDNIGNIIQIIDESPISNQKFENYLEYDKNKIKGIDKHLSFDFNILKSTVFHTYDKNGLETKFEEVFPNSKTIKIRYVYLKCKGK